MSVSDCHSEPVNHVSTPIEPTVHVETKQRAEILRCMLHLLILTLPVSFPSSAVSQLCLWSMMILTWSHQMFMMHQQPLDLGWGWCIVTMTSCVTISPFIWLSTVDMCIMFMQCNWTKLSDGIILLTVWTVGQLPRRHHAGQGWEGITQEEGRQGYGWPQEGSSYRMYTISYLLWPHCPLLQDNLLQVLLGQILDLADAQLSNISTSTTVVPIIS